MSEWRELKTLQDVAAAQAAGDEIEVGSDHVGAAWAWYKWDGEYWASDSPYRARPRQPKMKKLKMLCYLIGGRLDWFHNDYGSSDGWIRIPSEDKEIEVPE